MANEHFKSLLRKGQMATEDPRKALAEVAENAAAHDSIICSNCSNTLGVEPGLLSEGDTDPWDLPLGLGVWVTEADPIIDGAQDVEENSGKVIVCRYCGYDVTEQVQGFYGDAPNAS